MTEKEIRETMIKSAKLYLMYMHGCDKGIEKIPVNKITIISPQEIKLNLSKNLFYSDCFSLSIPGVEFSCEKLRVSNYDPDLRTLTICPPDDIYVKLSQTPSNKVFIVCDLRFLVSRVMDWYKEHTSITLTNPRRTCKVAPIFSQKDIDVHQEKAIISTLNSPVSYVWGAPGTGKTRYVLSNSVLSHVMANERVLIVAPTNNSLEQSLYGVLGVLESNGIDRKDVFRIGTPSYKFASNYPECCEVAGVRKRINELKEKIESLKTREENYEFYQRYNLLVNNIIPTVKEISGIIEYQNEIQTKLTQKKEQVKNINLFLDIEQKKEMKLTLKISELNKKLDNYSKPLISIFSKKKIVVVKNELAVTTAELEMCIKQQISYIEHKSNMLNEISELNVLLDFTIVTDLFSKLKALHISRPLSEIIAELDINNCNQVLDKLLFLEERGKEKIAKLGFDVSQISIDTIQKDIDKYSNELQKLEMYSSAHRIESAKVVAVTIDGFFSHSVLEEYSHHDSMHPFSHIYLDEAGYCSLIKGLALFSGDTPVTLLGDHMQLPPICEMNDEEFSKDENMPIFFWAQSILAIEDIFKYSIQESFVRYEESEDFEFDYLTKSDLIITYRFGKALSEILNSYVYKNGFKSAGSVDELIIRVIDAKKESDKQKRENIAEAVRIKEFLTTSEENLDYAILTPYRNQLNLLRQETPKANKEQRIMTIHASQGREFDTVILSVCDTKNMYFTDTTKKHTKGLYIINTAVSRAKKELIIVCDKQFWLSLDNQLISEIVRIAIQHR